MRNFRLLKADEIECRISQVAESGVTILLYKTARTDYQLLDEVIGMMRWQNDYKVIDGKMYCGIGVQDNNGEWIWKWNCGTESNTEAEKGQASDAMKRAGFAWGIGTELYSAPLIYVGNELLRKRKDKKVYDKFYVRSISYNDMEDINALVIVNHKGEIVYTFGKTTERVNAQPNPSAPQPTQATQSAPANVTQPAAKTATTAQPELISLTCTDCGAPIETNVYNYSKKVYGAPYCRKCQKNHAR